MRGIAALLAGVLALWGLYVASVPMLDAEWQRRLGSPEPPGVYIAGLAILFLMGMVYMLPAGIARSRGLAIAPAIFLVNLLLGWTLIGWLICFAVAAIAPRRDSPSGDDPRLSDAYLRELARLDHEERRRNQANPPA